MRIYIIIIIMELSPEATVSPDESIASAPGKVLLTGGYLVLEEGLSGLVVSSSSRFFARVLWVTSGAGTLTGRLYDGIDCKKIAETSCGRESGSPDADSSALVARTAVAIGAATGACAARGDGVGLVVVSPQFHAAWGYILPCEAPHSLVAADAAAPPSPFVEAAITASLATAAAGAVASGGDGDEAKEKNGAAAPLRTLLTRRAAAGQILLIVLGAHNDFYSQSASLRARSERATSAALLRLPHAQPPPIGARLAKTGLGSSAALTVSLVAALLAQLGVMPLCDPALVHAVSQVAHGRAQGKVGSGFDVASATYGSLRFSRVPANVLRAAMDAGDTEAPAVWGKRLQSLAAAERLAAAQLGTAVSSSDKTTRTVDDWSFTATPWALPRGLRLCLADVEGGSSTPDMVRKVLAWRERKVSHKEKEARPVGKEVAEAEAEAEAGDGPLEWRLLISANARVLQACLGAERAAADAPTVFDHALTAAAALPGREWSAVALRMTSVALGALGELSDAFAAWRRALRAMGEASGVPIEPPAQKARADALMELCGVVAAGVPGAGGEDALFALVVEPPGGGTGAGGGSARAACEALWAAADGVAPLLMREGAARGARGAGIRVGSSEVGLWGA